VREELLTITVADAPDGVTIRCRGELDVFTWERLDAAVERALAQEPAALALDLREVRFVDSSGLRSVMVAADRCAGAGVALHLDPGAATARLLAGSGLDQRWPALRVDPPAVADERAGVVVRNAIGRFEAAGESS
jgi:anti-anti-sigma factor